MAKNVITVNGKRFEVEGNNVSVVNDSVFVDGVNITNITETERSPGGIVKIEWQGDLASLDTQGSVSCKNVIGNVVAGGSVQTI